MNRYKLFRKIPCFERLIIHSDVISGGGNISGMLDALDAAQWKEMAITALPLRLSHACGHKTKREKQKM
jgi:hypothetical protein